MTKNEYTVTIQLDIEADQDVDKATIADHVAFVLSRTNFDDTTRHRLWECVDINVEDI